MKCLVRVLNVINNVLLIVLTTFLEVIRNFIRKGDALSLKKQLRKSNAGVECKDEIGNTPLLQAAFLGKFECVEHLLEIRQANYKVINVFGMKVRFLFKIYIEKNFVSLGQNALTLASYAGCIYCVKILLTKWTYKDYTETSLLPPLCVAAMKGHLDIVNFFCQLTPPPNSIQSSHGERIIHFLYKLNFRFREETTLEFEEHFEITFQSIHTYT